MQTTLRATTAKSILLLTALGLAGCAVAPPTGPSVAVMPAQGKTFEQFQADDATCRQFASQQIGVDPTVAANQSLVGSAAVGTVLGAAAGAAIGAATGNPAAGAAIGAGSGLFLGGATGLSAAQASGSSLQRRYDTGYIQCMSAKGESVPQQTTVASAGPTPYWYGYPNYYAYPYYYPGWYGPGFVHFGFGFHGGGHHFRHR
jgi:outer membrane lipoprotein SlyB